MARLVSVNVGRARSVPWRGSAVRTAIYKSAVPGSVFAGQLGLQGDEQADLVGHGGEHRAVLVYQLASYEFWRNRYGWPLLEWGTFGENLTVDGLADDAVQVGDRYRIGQAVFEVTQPRVTCFKLAVRLGEPGLPGELVRQGRPGFYLRVIVEGLVQAGDAITLLSRDPNGMPVAQIDALLYGQDHPRQGLQQALAIGALSAGWRGSLQLLLDQGAAAQGCSGNAGLVAGAEPTPAWSGFRRLRIAHRHAQSRDVESFQLVSSDGMPLPPGRAGQHLVLRLGAGERHAAPVHAVYSLAGPPDPMVYRIAIRRGPPGSVSASVCDALASATEVEASAPRGSFALSDGVRPVVLLGAGIGLTPLLAMLHALLDATPGARREVWWIHQARDGEHHPMRDEVHRLVSMFPQARSIVFYSQPADGDEIGVGHDQVGRVSARRLRDLGVPVDADHYLCGPGAFIEEMAQGLQQHGAVRERIRWESFGSPGLKPASAGREPGPLESQAGDADAVHVSFVRSHVSVRVGRQDPVPTLLDIAEQHGVPLAWSCRSGVCHRCAIPLLDGSVSYRVPPMSTPPSGMVLACCAWPRTSVVIDA